jgi:hypothetical protein
MKIILIICLLSASVANAQWNVMQKYNEVGRGNYYLFANTEKDAKRIILETLNDNNFSYEVTFNKGSNVFLTAAILDPLNNEYVYVIHSIKGRYLDRTG